MGGANHFLGSLFTETFLAFYTYSLFFLQVLIGGGQNHRMGLFDMVLIKDNHISAAGGISNAIKSVDLYLQQRKLKMNVEVLSQILTFLFVYIV